jgi:hypothetical protein
MNLPRPLHLIALLLTGLMALAFSPGTRADPIAIVTDPAASPLEQIAARELAGALQAIHPRDRFSLVAELPAAGKAVVVGLATRPSVRRHLGRDATAAPESYVIRRVRQDRLDLGIIAGADPRGTAYGVYALLRKLGCAFDLSGDALPRPHEAGFTFDGWDLGDRPLTGERLVFNWHNFLSGCSTWNLDDWRRWTTQTQKMGYNAIMVHAYGNNPMAAFTFEGTAKPVGYLSTTVKGRDWSTQHVNDVRRLLGGEVFDRAVFGAEAGLAPDAQRVRAAQALMQAVFAHAAERSMGVYFAVDVDTPSAHPPEMIMKLPERARFEIPSRASTAGGAPGKIWVPNPDTPEGYAFFRTEVEALVQTYPQITHLVAWFRRGGTPWMELKPADLPAAWQREFAAEIARTPEAAEFWHAAGLFAVGKIVRAFERALQDRAAGRVTLAAGTWGFEFLAGADRFFPSGVPLLGLDYDVLREKPQLGDAASRAPLRAIGARRPLIPIVWAHHDDGHYLGRPYTPLPDFASKLHDARASGFGIIHWTTRPLDLYFASLAQQIWNSTKDQPLRETCRLLAAGWFGPENREVMGEYLEAWMTHAPRFGRETSPRFIDRKLADIPGIIAGCRARLKLIDAAATAQLTREQRDRLDYHRGLEQFIAAFHEGQGRFQDSQEALQRGDRTGARHALAGFEPGALIEQFARFSAHGGITRGEQGLIVTMNTRWLSHVVQHRQVLGLEPLRVNFAPTSHDLLAQSRGTFTFHFDAQRALWDCRGTQETGANVFSLPATATNTRFHSSAPAAWKEIGQTGITSQQPLTIAVRPIMTPDNQKKPTPLPAGDYRLRVLLLDPTSTAPGQRVFDLAVRVLSAKRETAFTLLDRVDIFERMGGALRLLELSYPLRLESSNAGGIELRLTPVNGDALLCGVVLEPVDLP